VEVEETGKEKDVPRYSSAGNGKPSGLPILDIVPKFAR
jgi:hypothetical protein